MILVATGSQKMLIISDKEESHIGKAYTQAEKEHGMLQFRLLESPQYYSWSGLGLMEWTASAAAYITKYVFGILVHSLLPTCCSKLEF